MTHMRPNPGPYVPGSFDDAAEDVGNSSAVTTSTDASATSVTPNSTTPTPGPAYLQFPCQWILCAEIKDSRFALLASIVETNQLTDKLPCYQYQFNNEVTFVSFKQSSNLGRHHPHSQCAVSALPSTATEKNCCKVAENKQPNLFCLLWPGKYCIRDILLRKRS